MFFLKKLTPADKITEVLFELIMGTSATVYTKP